MTHILLVYGTTEGQTGKIARHIEKTLEDRGATVTLVEGHDLNRRHELGHFDGIIVGASVHVGKHDRHIVDFVRNHLGALETMPSAFFSVSLTAAGDTAEDKADIERLLREFSEETGWQPEKMGVFAGAVMYTKYNPMIRYVMKRKVATRRDDTDTTRDYEYTDWDGVTAFAGTFLDTVTGGDA